LLKALHSSQIRRACLDVFENEFELKEEFKHLSNVKLSPHIAAFTPQSCARKEEVVSEGIAKAFMAISQEGTAAE
jgi:phosphoglycerate dehydrogenase-like enzyme